MTAASRSFGSGPTDGESGAGPGVRPATASDTAVLDELRAKASAELSTRRGGPLLAAVSDGRDASPGQARAAGVGEFVGTYDGVPVGFGSVRLDTLGDVPIAHVHALYVEQEARGVGIGEALMAAIARWAEEHACAGLDVPVLPGARESKSFLEGAGFKARMIVMHRDLRADPS